MHPPALWSDMDQASAICEKALERLEIFSVCVSEMQPEDIGVRFMEKSLIL